jgi:5-methylcytosine-specific restriction endonuclease McrA
MNSPADLSSLNNAELLARTRQLIGHSLRTEADLLAHLGEIDERRLYLERAFPSMFAFCIGELGFSEAAAYDRITVGRAGRQLPAIIEALRSGQVHLTGLRLLVPHLTDETHREVLTRAAGKTKREIEELVACLAPHPAVPAVVRKLPEPSARASAEALPASLDLAPERASTCEGRQTFVAPLGEDMFKIQFTAVRALRDKLRQAQDLLRHRVPDGDLAAIIDAALDVLIERVKKDRFASGRNPRRPLPQPAQETSSRHIPDEIKRAVYERDAGRCTFTDERGRRCAETGKLEFDHIDGFARTHLHQADRIRLLCRAHNQHEADRAYGRAFMERVRSARASTRTGTSPQPRLL